MPSKYDTFRRGMLLAMAHIRGREISADVELQVDGRLDDEELAGIVFLVEQFVQPDVEWDFDHEIDDMDDLLTVEELENHLFDST